MGGSPNSCCGVSYGLCRVLLLVCGRLLSPVAQIACVAWLGQWGWQNAWLGPLVPYASLACVSPCDVCGNSEPIQSEAERRVVNGGDCCHWLEELQHII